ncbi:MAG: TetR/AcrR family transcriptional regulator C-terminal domain-containing protein [Anaerovoracaceae bacterium]|jgi:probable dihydroxyacetone kinase regulator
MAKGQITKNQIMEVFMDLMEEKSFNEITISDITERCNLNRLTFYYHFQDKYDLLNQSIDLMIMYPFMKDLTFDNWPDHLCYALETIKAHKKFCMNAFTSDNGEFMDHIGAIISQLFTDLFEEMPNVSKTDKMNKVFLADFLSYGIIGTVEHWMRSGMKGEPREIVTNLERMTNEYKRIAVESYITLAFSDTSENEDSKEENGGSDN